MDKNLNAVAPIRKKSENHLMPENSDLENHKKNAPGLLVLLIVGLVFLAPGSSNAGGFFDYQGVAGFYGHSDWTNVGPEPRDKYEWYNISYLMGKNITPWLSLETLSGPGYIRTQNFNKTGSLELRLAMDIHGKYLYFKLGTGIAYLFDSADMPDLSSANFFSIVSCSTGFRFFFGEETDNGPEIRLGYSVEHLSDPFKGGEDGDTGLNIGAITAILSWTF
ncbi:MAG: hypothetical protein KKC20_01720 [Proteobacteria bacterium]|nr:hypothetical protein [Pseudomonadota bacterium]